MIQGLHKSLAYISFDIKGLQHQATPLDKALSKPPSIGMNSITITANELPTFEETYNELMQYTDLLAPQETTNIIKEK
jgi:hypothetical protein